MRLLNSTCNPYLLDRSAKSQLGLPMVNLSRQRRQGGVIVNIMVRIYYTACRRRPILDRLPNYSYLDSAQSWSRHRSSPWVPPWQNPDQDLVTIGLISETPSYGRVLKTIKWPGSAKRCRIPGGVSPERLSRLSFQATRHGRR